MAITCDICGATSDLDEIFSQVSKSFSTKKTTYCPTCWEKREQSSRKSSYWFWGIFAIYSVAKATLDPQEGWLLFNVLVISLCGYLLIIPHELGHALVAKWLGWRVVKITVGSGRIIKRFAFWGLRWEISQIPTGGLTYCFATSARWYRTKDFLIVLGGPAVNLCFLLLALFLIHSQNLNASLFNSFSPVWCLVWANVLSLVSNLFPRSINTAIGKTPNDGLLLLKILFYSKDKIKQCLPSFYTFQGSEFLDNMQFNEAKDCYQQGLKTYPDNFYLQCGLMASSFQLGEYKKAQAMANQLLDKEIADERDYSWVLNFYAYTNALVGDPELLEEADHLSAEALEIFPDELLYKATRGVVLVELGQLDEGIELLKQAMIEDESKFNKADNASYLAIAEMRKGNPEIAQQYLDAALQFNAMCPLIKRAQDELGQIK